MAEGRAIWVAANRHWPPCRTSTRVNNICAGAAFGVILREVPWLTITSVAIAWEASGVSSSAFGRAIRYVEIPWAIDRDEDQIAFIGLGPRLVNQLARHVVEGART